MLHSSATTGPNSDTESATYTQEQLIPRLGLDAGGRHLRLRTTIELAVGPTQRDSMSRGIESTAGVQGLTLGAALAYRF